MACSGGCGDTKFSNSTLDDLFEAFLGTPSDINEHGDTLREYASQCAHVTDIGMRAESTISLAAGRPNRFISVGNPNESYRKFVREQYAKEGKSCELVEGSTPDVEIEETDLLFIDTKHTANHLALELEKYATKVRRYIIRHDTDVFGVTGEDGGPGLIPAFARFMREHPEWSVIYHTDRNNGLTVLSRNPEDKPKLPPLAEQLFNYGKHWADRLTGNEGTVPLEVMEERLQICAVCPLRNNTRCSKCGCYLDENPTTGELGRTAWKGKACPVLKWKEHTDE